MANKLIRAEDVLKMRGYNTTALNGTEILGIIGEYYLTHDLSDTISLRSVRFVEYKDAPSSGFIDLTTIDAALSLRKEHPSLFKRDTGILGDGDYYNPYPWLWFLQNESAYEHYLEGKLSDEFMERSRKEFVPTIFVDEASEKAVVKFIKSIGGYKISGKNRKYTITIV